MKRQTLFIGVLTLLLIGVMFSVGAGSPAQASKLEPGLREAVMQAGESTYMVYMVEQADLSKASKIDDWSAKGWYVYNTLRKTAKRSQASIIKYLDSQGISYRPFYIVNVIAVTSGVETLDALAARSDVAYIEGAKTYAIPEPRRRYGTESTQAVEWGVDRINAPDVWSVLGLTGEGIVVANVDTGVDYTHPALVDKYRGNNGDGTFTHDYNWFDPSNICSPAGVPCDNNDHGTHTMGTMVGDDGAGNQIGVAPGAKWIAAKGCESTTCSEFALLASAEWILAPYPIGGTPDQGDPDMRPNVVNNSWGGVGGDPWYLPSVQAWRAAGIFPAFAAGNSGPGVGTVISPGDYAESFAMGATDISDVVAWFSSRGPSSMTTEQKPDITAPGVDVRSSIPGGGYANFDGTSMATPHAAGCAALLMSSGEMDITYIEDIMTGTAVDLGDPGPDNDYGYGRLDCFAAAMQLSPSFTLQVTPESANVCAVADTDYLVDVGSISGFSDPVTLSASGAPAAVNFDVNPVTPPGTSTMTVGSGSVAGLYHVAVSGMTITETKVVTVGLNVFDSAPGVPTLLSPPDGAVDTAITPLLEWSAGTQSSDFMVEVATDIDFTNVVFSATVGTENVVATGLEPLSTYFWRVQAMNPCGSGEYSATWSFTTKDVPPVLLVDDDDNSPDVRGYYTEVLDHMGIEYDIWDTNNSDEEPSEFDLAPYRTVIWFTGDEFGGYAGPGSAGESALAAWLDSARAFQANRCFVISSQDYIWDRGITSFMTGYLGIADGESDVGQTEVTGRGPIGTWNLVYPFTNYSDRLFPGNGGVWFYHGNQGTAGTAKITDNYATAFLGFPLEALPHPRPRGQTLLFFLRTCNSLP